MKAKPSSPKQIRPWTPGSVSPIYYRPGVPDEANEIYDRPIPIRELAKIQGVRCYRDACGDDQILGKYGEIFRHGIGRLGVQIGGPRANNTKTDVSEGSNQRINTIAKRYKWPVSQGGDGEIIFIVPGSDIKDALQAIRAYRMPKGGTPPDDPEARERGLRALRKRRDHVGI